MSAISPFRVLVVDDTPAIHDDYRKVLCWPSIAAAAAAAAAEVSEMEALLFGEDNPTGGDDEIPKPSFVLESAFQGRDGIAKVRDAIGEGQPYAMAFVDMRMPPGLDGVQTIREMWKVDANLQVAICTAYSDYTAEQISQELAIDSRIIALRKPFEAAQVRQVARALCEKWQMRRAAG